MLDSARPTLDDNSTGSKASFERMKLWMEICRRYHTKCNKRCVPGWQPVLPKRVLDVGDSASHSSQLVSGNGHGQYATLSHCWGARQPLTTSKATIADREREIADTQLPPTFKDAVTVCRQIGVQYLWIDSLCILQDSVEDWESEAAAMSDIYHYSMFTIAAAGADSTKGCFQARNGLTTWPWFGTVFGTPSRISRHSGYRMSLYFEQLDNRDNYLSSRAWVLQEQLLSCRTLVFGRKEMAWRCLENYASESYALGHRNADLRDAYRLRLQDVINDDEEREDNPTDADVFKCWYRMIENYTSRKLTVRTDKLIAVAGLAGRFATAKGLNYRAGLWKEDILFGLLWSAHRTGISYGGPQQPADPIAPTWSWASITGRVFYDVVNSDLYTTMAVPLVEELEFADPTTGMKQMFAPTSRMVMQVRAHLVPVTFKKQRLITPDGKELGKLYVDSLERHPTVSDVQPAGWFAMPLCVVHRGDVLYRAITIDQVCQAWEDLMSGNAYNAEHSFNSEVWCLVLEAPLGHEEMFMQYGRETAPVTKEAPRLRRVGICSLCYNYGEGRRVEIVRASMSEKRMITIE